MGSLSVKRLDSRSEIGIQSSIFQQQIYCKMEQKTSLNYDEDSECSYQLYLKGTLRGIGKENE